MAKDLSDNRDTLLENERQVALGSLIPVVAHNVRNPLASIRATAQLLEDAENKDDITESKNAIISSDLIIGSVLIPGKKPPVIISNEDISKMEKGTVIIDVAIDQGGCTEDVKANTHSEPFENRDGILISAIANLPGAVPKTSSIELSTALQKYVHFLLEDDWFENYKNNKNLRPSLQIHNGLLLSEEVGDSLSLSVSKLV